VGGDFQVNTYTTWYQVYPSVGVAPDGDFVVVWRNFVTPTSSIQAQRYASDGSALGGEFQVNTTGGHVFSPVVAVAGDGDFVVVWSGPEITHDIRARRFASDGSAQGADFQVNTYTTNAQTWPAVGAAPDGDFVVVWGSDGSSGTDTSATSVHGQRYASDGSTQGGQFQINTYTTSQQDIPRVAVAPDSGFVVVWTSFGTFETDTSTTSVQGQRYASDGSAQGGQFQVNSYTTSYQFTPSVAAGSGGDFVVAWRSQGSAGTDTGYSIQARRFGSDGSAQGADFQVNVYTTSSQYLAGVPAVAAVDGEFIVTWGSSGSFGKDSSGQSVQARRYASDGSPVDGQFQVNTYTTDHQSHATIAAASDGFVVAWQSRGSLGTDSSFWSIQARRFSYGVPLAVPSLSPGAAAAAALLMLVAVAVAFRRRV
jgi:hypothetical protein